jgi:CheY-like chemotaxis protein
VAIYRLLRNVPFEPEHIEALAKVYEDTLRSLKLVSRSDPLTELIAKTIFEAAQAGERDPIRLQQLVLSRLGLGSEENDSVSEPDEQTAGGVRSTVLIVEDDETFAYTVERHFQSLGYTTVVATGSLAAFAELDRQPIDVVITDVRLNVGEPHGISLARMIRNRNSRTPVLIVTAFPELVVKEEALPGPVFVKPVELRVLAKAVECSLAA